MKRWLLVLLLLAGCGNDMQPAPPVVVSGVWTGTYQIQSCQNIGASAIAVDGCTQFQNSLGTGPLPVRLTLNQSGTSATGTLELGSLQVPVTGPVTGNQLALNGQATLSTGTTLNTSGWAVTFTAGAMNGPFSYAIVAPDLSRIAVSAQLALQRA